MVTTSTLDDKLSIYSVQNRSSDAIKKICVKEYASRSICKLIGLKLVIKFL